MVKLISLFLLVSLLLSADAKMLKPNIDPSINSGLEKDCLACHQEQKIPSEFIYRRYLMKYSSKETIRKKLFSYLKSPSQQNSVMPPQFFGKYVVKEPTQLSDEILQKRIDDYIRLYDVGQKLFISK